MQPRPKAAPTVRRHGERRRRRSLRRRKPVAPATCEPAEERIADLLKAGTSRIVLLASTAADEPQPASAVNAPRRRLQENNFSVYSAASLFLLEKAALSGASRPVSPRRTSKPARPSLSTVSNT
ncbi:MAG: hypothetical protein ACLT98_13150 [Eggerthellaceae bacterium]